MGRWLGRLGLERILGSNWAGPGYVNIGDGWGPRIDSSVSIDNSTVVADNSAEYHCILYDADGKTLGSKGTDDIDSLMSTVPSNLPAGSSCTCYHKNGTMIKRLHEGNKEALTGFLSQLFYQLFKHITSLCIVLVKIITGP